MATKKTSARSWKDIRAILSKADDKEVLKLVGELYALRKENQDFLHTRYLNDTNTLGPYKETIARYISPAEPWKNPVKISKARKAISDYRKAAGDPKSLAELMLFYVESAISMNGRKLMKPSITASFAYLPMGWRCCIDANRM